MSVRNFILYLGSDSGFQKELFDTFQEMEFDGIDFSSATYRKGCMVRNLFPNSNNILLVDFTYVTNIQEVIQEVIHIKRSVYFKSTLLVAVFNGQENKNLKTLLLTAGFQLFFLKGGELDTLLRDSVYIGFRKDIQFPEYAEVKLQHHYLKIKSPSTFVKVDGKEMILETDLELSGELELNFPMYPSLPVQKYAKKEKKLREIYYPMMNHYRIEIPVAGAWDEISGDKIQEDTFDTWKNLHQSYKKDEIITIKVFSKNADLFREVFLDKTNEDIRIDFYNNYQEEFFDKEILQKKTSIIFYDLPSKPGQNLSLEQLGTLVSDCNTPGPIIIATNTPSKTAALQKLFGYSNLLCSAAPLSADILWTLVQSLYARRKKVDRELYHLPLELEDRCVDIQFDAEIMSLNEHEITFTSTASLPVFSIVKFKLPFEFVATIVPSLSHLPRQVEKKSYMAFLNGIDEDSLVLLRRFINQIIYTPLKDLKEETLEAVMAKLEADKNNEESAELGARKKTKKVRSRMADETDNMPVKSKL